MYIKIGKNRVAVSGKNIKEALSSKIFRQWSQSLGTDLMVRSIQIQSVDFTNRDGKNKVLFVKLNADIRDIQGRKLPGIVFLRGHSVGILVVLICDKQEYVALVNQARPAIGMNQYLELPAGMVDEQGDVRSVALRELREEIGIDVPKKKLVNLSRIFFEGKWNKIYPSPGACDEGVELFLVRQTVSKKAMDAFMKKTTGLAAENEYITLSLIKLEDVCRVTPSSMVHSAYLMYTKLKLKEIGL